MLSLEEDINLKFHCGQAGRENDPGLLVISEGGLKSTPDSGGIRREASGS